MSIESKWPARGPLVIGLLAETCRGFHHIGSAILFGGALTGLGNILIVGGGAAGWMTASYLRGVQGHEKTAIM